MTDTLTALDPRTLHGVSLFTSGPMTPSFKPKMSFGKSKFADVTGEVLSVTDVAVFRSGTFRDSMGIQATWETFHMDQMIANYDHLVRTKVFERVPVRKGHGSFFGDPMDSLVGWHTALRTKEGTNPVDGKTYTYLVTDYEIFDEQAKVHVHEGHWPNRSAEIGYFLTNAEAEFWPVYQGFAFVDIPAVEGLNAFSKQIDFNNSKTARTAFFMEGAPMGDSTATPGTGTGDQPKADERPKAEDQPTTTPGEPTNDDNDDPDPSTTDQPVPPAASDPAEPAAPAAPAEPAAPAGDAQHGKQAGVQAFKINGQETTDFSAVQAHIDTLEGTLRESDQQSRADFVSALATAGKIAAPQIDSLTKHAQGLSAAQFAEWKKSYDDVPESSLFGRHGKQKQDEGAPEDAATAAAEDDLNIARSIVQNHRSAGRMSEASIRKTPSYQKLHKALPDEFPID